MYVISIRRKRTIEDERGKICVCLRYIYMHKKDNIIIILGVYQIYII